MLDDGRDRERDDLRVSRIRLETRCNCIILSAQILQYCHYMTSVRLGDSVTMLSDSTY